MPQLNLGDNCVAVAKLWSIIGPTPIRQEPEGIPGRAAFKICSLPPDDIFRLMIDEEAGARNEISRRWKSNVNVTWIRKKGGLKKKEDSSAPALIMEKQCTPRCSTCHVRSTNNWFGGEKEREKERRLSFFLPFGSKLAIWSGSDSRYFHTALEHLSKRRANSSISFFSSVLFQRFSCRSNWFTATKVKKLLD